MGRASHTRTHPRSLLSIHFSYVTPFVWLLLTPSVSIRPYSGGRVCVRLETSTADVM